MEFSHFIFTPVFDDLQAFEAESKGYLSGVEVVMKDGSKHPVWFYEHTRLAQDLEIESKIGRPFIAEKGMIVVANVTLDIMLKAVETLSREGFFD